MRFTLQRDAPPGFAGIRVVPVIANFPLCRLEGRNGVGKSLAVRLLQLCLGEQPYADLPRAWGSLREGLGPITIEVTSLQGAESVEWTLDPQAWPDEPKPLTREGCISVSINGLPASIKEARDLISVERIAGEETLPQTIALLIRSDYRAAASEKAAISDRLADLQAVLARFANDLGRINIERFQSAADAVDRLDREHAASRRQLSELTMRREKLIEAKQFIESADAAVRLGPKYAEGLAALDRQLAEARAANHAADTTLHGLRPPTWTVEELGRHLTEAQTTRDRRDRNLSSTEERLALLGRKLDLEPTSENAINRRVSAQARLTELEAEKRSIDLTPLVSATVRQLSVTLRSAVREGLAEQGVANLDGDVLSASRLDGAVDIQRRDLAGRPKPEELQAIDKEIVRLVTERVLLDEVLRLRSRETANRASLASAQDALEYLLAQARSQSSEEYSRALNALHAAHQVEIQLERQRGILNAELQSVTGGIPAEELVRRRDEALAQCKVTQDGLVAEIAGVQDVLRDAAADDLRSAEAVTENQRLLDDGRRGIQIISDSLSSLPEYTALRRSVGSFLPSPALGESENLKRIAAFQAAVGRSADQVAETRLAIEQILETVQSLAACVGAGSPPESGYLRLPSLVNHYYGPRVTSRFQRREFEEALFDGGRLTSIGLLDATAYFVDQNGVERGRPFEALSSGERVFSYTLARIGAPDRPTARNRVLFLDEFGAFVAHDRIRILLGLLRDLLLQHRAEQIVVILPLGAEHDRDPDKVPVGEPRNAEEQLKRDGYFAEPFES